MAEYRTPDGRTVNFPEDMAAVFQGLTPVEPPASSAGDGLMLPNAPPQPSEPQPAGPAMTPPGMNDGLMRPDAAQSPMAAPGQFGPQLPGVVQQSPAPQPGPTQPVQQPASAQPQPPKPIASDKDLSKLGISGALNDQIGALNQSAQATQGLADVEADESRKVADEYAARNARADAIELEKQKAIQERAQRVQAATIDAQKAMDAYSNHKVDRSFDHPVLAAISLALGGIGGAMSGKNDNPALGVLMQQLDRKVQLQLADRAKLKDVAGAKEAAIDRVRRTGSDNIEQYNLAMAAEAERTIRKIQEIGARSGSDKVKANAQLAIAALSGKAADYKMAGVERRLTLDEQQEERAQRAQQHKQSLGVQYAGLRQSDRHFNETMKLNREKEANDFKIAMAKNTGTGSEAYQKALKENEERGIRDPVTGEFVLNAQGRKLMKQADAIDAEVGKLREQATKETDPAKKANLEMRAKAAEDQGAVVRTEARMNAIRGRSPDHAAKVANTVGSAQTMLTLIDKIKARTQKAGTKVLNANELQAALETEMGILGLQAKDLYTLGSLDEGASKYLDKITGGDPSKLTTSSFLGAFGIGSGSAEKAAAKLDALAGSVEQRAYNELGSIGFDRQGFEFRRDKLVKPTAENKAAEGVLGAKTPGEEGKAQESGAVRKAITEYIPGTSTLYKAFGGKTDAERKETAEIRSSSQKFPGFSKAQENHVAVLLKAAKRDDEAGKVARERLIQFATMVDREDISNATLTTLQTELPDVYKQALAKLPKEYQDARAIPRAR